MTGYPKGLTSAAKAAQLCGMDGPTEVGPFPSKTTVSSKVVSLSLRHG